MIVKHRKRGIFEIHVEVTRAVAAFLEITSQKSKHMKVLCMGPFHMLPTMEKDIN